MSTRKHTPRSRGFRPEAVPLESRQLLSAVVSGTDSKGDAWTLRLIGPGSLSVVKQNATGTTTPAALTSKTDINTITVGGTDPLKSRIVGTVTAAPGSDGRVFFQNLVQLAGRSETLTGTGNGLVAINMPNFWLGNTSTAGSTPTAAPRIAIPDGVDSLVFGGVDNSVNKPTLTSSATSDPTLISLGLPTYGGTRIIINKSISSTQTVPATPPATAATTVQLGVVFAVSGRLDLFQANEIDGDSTTPPGQFKDFNANATGLGGTIVVSTTPTSSGAGALPPNLFTFTNGQTEFKGASTGAIGDVRVGGNATNFSTYVFDPSAGGGDKLGNFSVGGETNNVLVVAPTGARNLVFGKGMDTVEILTHVINALQANRGALNSRVYAGRTISRIDLGGDVVNTRILSGYDLNFLNILGTVNGLTTGSPGAPPNPVNAQMGGGMTLHVAGSVTNSVFAASVQPALNDFTKFGDPNELVLPGGHIASKIEGPISNPVAAPNTPKQAVFAKLVTALTGPVVPPNVPEAPYTGPSQPTHVPGIHHLNRSLINVATATATTTTAATNAKTTPKAATTTLKKA